MYKILIILLITLTGCQSMVAKKVMTKTSRYVRDRENDYHRSYLCSPLKMPKNLKALDSESDYASGKDMKLTCEEQKTGKVSIKPPLE